MPLDGSNVGKTAGLLLRAKTYIQEHGWSNDGPINGNRVCITESLVVVRRQSDTPYIHLASNCIIEAIIGKSYGGCYIGGWNDTPGRTVEEVFAVFDRAVEIALERYS